MTKAEKQKKFWEKMAERYPTPFSEESLEKTGKVISMAEQRGVRIDGAAVLDIIGCGTGIYTLPLAKRAARMTALTCRKECCGGWRMSPPCRGRPWSDEAVQAALGIHVEIETVRRTWDWEGTVEEAFEYVEGFIESQSDTEPQPDLIRAAIARFIAEDGSVRHQTEMEMGMMVVWQAA